MIAISIKNISKKFIYSGSSSPFILHIKDFFSGKDYKTQDNVLDSISFNVEKNEVLGIIGKNGSGKSTLLKILSDIYVQDSGSVSKSGKSMYISGHGYGMVHNLTVRDNIFMKGLLLGVPVNVIRKLYNKIIDFAEIGEYTDYLMSQLSTGMSTRIAFSATVHFVEYVNPDILLLDEVFSGGGDFSFNKKSVDKIDSLIKGKTVIIVSHNVDILKNKCKRVVWLKNGKVKLLGETNSVIDEYFKDDSE